MGEHAAVILAGGAGRRLGGLDKPGLVVGKRSLLDTAIGACRPCADIVVVGPSRSTGRQVSWAIEDPPGSGPLAALAAGLAAVPDDASTVVVLAADLPAVTVDTVTSLHEALAAAPADAVLLTDRDGRQQPLTAIYARAALERALGVVGDPRGAPIRAVLPHLRIATLGEPQAVEDIDTPEDLARWMRQPREP